MRLLSILFLTVAIARQVCHAQTAGTDSSSVAEISYSISTKLLLSQEYFEKQGNKSISNKLEKVSNTFSQISEGLSNVRPSIEYIAAFKGYDKVIASLQTIPQASALQLLDDI
ncbi:hypothetical protein EXU85_03595 [Spirosoma sp. KCTC 42546]|uniref:hypothetical protein n=1 Tax=Spirosoma sp. KCTC 42546 TaxID=2520506 RepID=UPI0011586F47|nr:hypothetical protein [Spirosoma sp. KCTC 42546]QDK77726.1 hypothetical protein EXU85_03595 [Spirosoma sp. KCTC 42546]